MILEKKYGFDDVMMLPRRSHIKSRSQVSITKTIEFPHANFSLECTPIVASNMFSVGTIEFARVMASHKCLTTLHKFNNIDEVIQEENQYAIPTFGIRENDIKNLHYYVKHTKVFPIVHLDVANGYMVNFTNIVEQIARKYNKEICIFAGTICTPEGRIWLENSFSDVVKVGLGSGSNCTTRIKTGIGYPQFSAINDLCGFSFKSLIMSDGGCRMPGDICKAIGAGADFVMLAGMLAAHEENTLVENIDENGNVLVYGMSSNEAKMKHMGYKPEYGTTEGRKTSIPYRGKIENTLQDIFGGMRSCASYLGVDNIFDIKHAPVFILTNEQHNTIFEDMTIGE